ncbi:MAG: hypothetical protein IH840_10600 [Candidatus Heimdallarchaeota archaeon]|nr:hypothetical protein [Candidatus Heimdallarchaeota archaeon]
MDTKTVKMPAKSGGKSVAFPTPLKLVLILSGVMLYRASLLSSISNLGDTIPEFWIVAFTGDIFVGLTALIVVPLLWKSRTLLAWTIGIIWHVIGLKDYTVGFQLHFVEPFDESLGSTPIFVFTFGIIVHIICISLLVRYRHYYLAD